MSTQDVDAAILLAAGCSEAPQWSRHAYEAILAPGGALRRFAFIAASEQALGGFAVASWLPQEADAEVESLVVDGPYRRQGLGSALLRACLVAAAQAGAASMRLEVRASNAAALALYQRNGFQSTGRRRAYYSAPVDDAVLLQALLGSPRLQGPL